ncbi:MAG: aspartyl-phosphate phosphatase Spo0E family protein [Paenisporosarcina sp.]|nr:aspartyl-phosphate phosphatase Spo0E family protein [Paenisporosarcina sp.]
MRRIHKKVILLSQIKMKQKIMYNRAKNLGRTHSSVIACSQELDLLLNKYQDIQSSDKRFNNYSHVS